MKLDFKLQLQLKNERALLRPLSPKDFETLLSFAESEPELWDYSLLPAAGAKNLKSYISYALEERAANRSYPFLVIDKASNKVAGSTRFYDYQPVHNTIQLGFTWYGKEFQGTGLNRNCKYLMLDYAFNHLELDRVEFRADYKNKRSIAAMKNLGCKEEGVLRSNCSSPTGRRDSIVLSILKSEWDENICQELRAKIDIQ